MELKKPFKAVNSVYLCSLKKMTLGSVVERGWIFTGYSCLALVSKDY